jgi:ribosome-binding protein aMBF1 (putative translation factor)
MMNKKTIEKMKAAQAEQVKQIRKLDCYDDASQEFDLEYELAKELHEARAGAKLTQAEIAVRMGTTQSVISRIERGSNVSVETLARYAKACGKHLEVHLV